MHVLQILPLRLIRVVVKINIRDPIDEILLLRGERGHELFYAVFTAS